ncbi:unnamed protein product [Alopecurus aequalis]
MAAEAERQAHRKRTEPSREEEDGKAKALPRLRRLELVRVAAARAVVCLAALYGLAKSRAGPHRPTVDAVESAAARVVWPVYVCFRGIPLAVLVFLDRKVDDMVQELDRKLPPSLKTTYAAVRAVPEVAKELLTKARRSGVVSVGCAAYLKVEPVAKNLYLHYGPAAGRLAVCTWRSLKRLPPFPQVAKIAVTTAAHWAERYNRSVAGARWLPPIPTKLIAKFFSDRGVGVTHAE